MSTRSGKRIHNSFHEDTCPKEPEIAVKSERKTRSKRVKENVEDLSVSIFKNKKRNNYVSYPTDDEFLGDTAGKHDEETKPSRVLRKNTLKEQNPIENNEHLEKQEDVKNLIRKSRRGKRGDPEENENHENEPINIVDVPKIKQKKKKKKNIAQPVIDTPLPEAEVPIKNSKKKKKKGKKTSSIIVEDIVNNNPKNVSLNKSNMSIDSFHSAACSPVPTDNDVGEEQTTKLKTTFETNKQDETNKSSVKNNKKININTSLAKDDASTSETMTVDADKDKNNDISDRGSNKRKSLIRERIIHNKIITPNKHDTEDIQDPALNTSHLSNGQLRRRKSSVKDATFDKTNTSIINDDDSESKLNKLNNFEKRRRSSVKDISLTKDKSTNNDTFDRVLRTRSSSIKDITFNKSSNKEDAQLDSNLSHTKLRARKSTIEHVNDGKHDFNDQQNSKNSTLKDTTFDKSNGSIINISNIKTNEEEDVNVSNVSNKQLRKRKSNIKDSTFDKSKQVINTTFEKAGSIEQVNKKDTTFDKIISKQLDATYEKDMESDSTDMTNKNKSSVNTTYNKTNDTFEKDSSTSFNTFKKGAMTRKSDIKDATFDKSNTSITSLTKEDFENDKKIISSSVMKRKSLRRHTIDKSDTITEHVNTTYEKPPKSETELPRKSPRLSRSTSLIQAKLNTTFEKDNDKDILTSDSKSSLISSDNSNVTDKSDISRISITSDDTNENIENIVNTTPVLIESSMDESQISSKQISPQPQTPLKREGTFTKDGPDVLEEKSQTPTKKVSIPTAGCTPYHVSKSSQKKNMLNVTRSIEKGRVSVEPAPRMTRVMFCSPVNNPVMATQEKRKIIKSNLKGSNKSFVFEESASISRPSRKRSYTQSDAEDARVKRTRLTGDLQQSVDRLSRPRTVSAAGKISVTTPSKKPTTPSKQKSETKLSRTKLPNFAALHQKQFDKMESLGECQERKAKRAKQLLTPTAPPGLLERISPKNNTDSPKSKEPAKTTEKTDTPTKKLPTLESLRPGFTRFGFKLNYDINPFSIPSKTDKKSEKKVKPVEKALEKPLVGLPKSAIMPSLTGATSIRREVAKQTVMREKSFTDKRNINRTENRTIIKGVRTNRRFELQMKMRNID